MCIHSNELTLIAALLLADIAFTPTAITSSSSSSSAGAARLHFQLHCTRRRVGRARIRRRNCAPDGSCGYFRAARAVPQNYCAPRKGVLPRRGGKDGGREPGRRRRSERRRHGRSRRAARDRRRASRVAPALARRDAHAERVQPRCEKEFFVCTQRALYLEQLQSVRCALVWSVVVSHSSSHVRARVPPSASCSADARL